jgi:NAD(P)-dependent dehydrogenase (short-subunit alcohol dehydrogenase family)
LEKLLSIWAVVMKIENCIALVTGANRGLGKAYVDALLAAGAAKVYAGARDIASIGSTNDRVVSVRLDVTQEDQVRAAAQRCSDVTLLINNAGIMKNTPMLAEGSEEALRAEMEVNVFGVLRIVRAFAPVLSKNGGGAIVNMLSVVSWFVNPGNATYCASKYAALAVTDAVRIQLKAQATQVLAIHAGYIDTDMAAGVDSPKVSAQQVAARTLDGLREGKNSVHADQRSEEVWQKLKTDPEGLHARLQQAWDRLIEAKG